MRYPFKEHKKEYEENQVKLEQDIVKTYVESESWAQFMIESDLKGFFYGVSGKIEKFAIWCAYMSFNRSRDFMITACVLIELCAAFSLSTIFVITMNLLAAAISILILFVVLLCMGTVWYAGMEYWRDRIWHSSNRGEIEL